MSGKDITRLLQGWRQGDDDALNELTPLVYGQLRTLAAKVFAGESAGHTLQPTALVNEVFEKLVDSNVDWHDRNHFFALSARLMRRLLVNHANAKNAAKRGGQDMRVTFHEAMVSTATANDDDILMLDAAIAELQEFDERKAEILELHYFAGLTYVELADLMELSESTVHQDLRTAKAWLYDRMA